MKYTVREAQAHKIVTCENRLKLAGSRASGMLPSRRAGRLSI